MQMRMLTMKTNSSKVVLLKLTASFKCKISNILIYYDRSD